MNQSGDDFIAAERGVRQKCRGVSDTGRTVGTAARVWHARHPPPASDGVADGRGGGAVKAQLVRFAVQSKGVGAVATVGVPSAAPEIAEMCVSEVNARGSSLLLPSNYA